MPEDLPVIEPPPEIIEPSPHWGRPLSGLKDDLTRAVLESLSAPVTVGGFTLPAQDDDRNKYAQLVSAWDTAAGLLPSEDRAAFMAAEVSIGDADGALHSMTRLAAVQLLLGYADAYYARWLGGKAKCAEIAAATTEEAANSAAHP